MLFRLATEPAARHPAVAAHDFEAGLNHVQIHVHAEMFPAIQQAEKFHQVHVQAAFGRQFRGFLARCERINVVSGASVHAGPQIKGDTIHDRDIGLHKAAQRP